MSKFYNQTAANLQQTPALLSDLITLMGQAAEGEEQAVCVCADVTAPAGVCKKAWAKSNMHMCTTLSEINGWLYSKDMWPDIKFRSSSAEPKSENWQTK